MNTVRLLLFVTADTGRVGGTNITTEGEEFREEEPEQEQKPGNTEGMYTMLALLEIRVKSD